MMALPHYQYRADVLAQLAAHGIIPSATTSPDLVHEYLNDLYRFELRRLRSRLLRREVLKEHYYGHVVELRRKYPLLSVPRTQWLE
jgi:hypothetical protein